MHAQPNATLEVLLQGVTASVKGDPRVAITSIDHDSRAVRPGALFFCLRGARADGHAFAADAVARGAVALVVDHDLAMPAAVTQAIVADPLAALSPVAAAFFGHPSRTLTCVGVTGTNGKTTTTFLFEAIAQAAGLSYGLSGTLGAWLGGSLRHEQINTTPFADEVQRWLALCRDEGAGGAVMEVSSHALALHRVDDVEFDVAVLTNLTQDHLDFHGDFESYRKAKRALFLRAQGARRQPPPCAVLNLDDPEGQALAVLLPKRVTYAIENGSALLHATGVELRADGSRFWVRALRPAPFALRLAGPFNVSNALAALGAACALDIDVEAMAEGLESVHEIPGRMVALPAGDATVYVDYAHTPDGLEKVLRATRAVTAKTLICVFGCGGDRDRQKRPLMGRVAQELADRVIVTTDNPRHEEPGAIIQDILAGMHAGRAEPTVILDRTEAIDAAIRAAQPGDVVLIAGKGHENYQIVGDERRPYSDLQVVRDAIREHSPCR